MWSVRQQNQASPAPSSRHPLVWRVGLRLQPETRLGGGTWPWCSSRMRYEACCRRQRIWRNTGSGQDMPYRSEGTFTFFPGRDGASAKLGGQPSGAVVYPGDVEHLVEFADHIFAHGKVLAGSIVVGDVPVWRALASRVPSSGPRAATDRWVLGRSGVCGRGWIHRRWHTKAVADPSSRDHSRGHGPRARRGTRVESW